MKINDAIMIDMDHYGDALLLQDLFNYHYISEPLLYHYNSIKMTSAFELSTTFDLMFLKRWSKTFFKSKIDKYKGTFLWSAVSSQWDNSKCFTLHRQADQFINTNSTLHFTPWQTSSLTPTQLYISPPGRPVY